MKTELDERSVAELRRVLARMESSAPLAPDLETVASRPASSRPQIVRGLGVAGLAAAVVFAVLIPVLFFSGQQPEQTVTVSPPSTDVPTTQPTTAEPAVDVEWTHVEASTRVDQLVVHQDGFVAVVQGVALSSVDGTEWAELGQLPADEWASVSQLVSHGQVLLASGADISTDPDGGRSHTHAIWISKNGGVTWDRADIEETIRDVVSTPSGLVAVGSIDLGPDGDRVRQRAAVWESDDGMVWTLVWSSDDPEGTSSIADAVIWDGTGLTVLGQRGLDQFHEGAGEPANPVWSRVAWAGPNPLNLADPVDIELPGFIEAHAQNSVGHIVLVYGFDRSVKDSSAIWRSADGLDWAPFDVDAGSWSYNGVATDSEAIVIVGDTLGASADPEPKVWVSADGDGWDSLDVFALPEKLRLGSVAIHDGVLVVSGYHDSATTGYLITGRVAP